MKNGVCMSQTVSSGNLFETVLKVSELNSLLKTMVEKEFPRLAVEGEVSGATRAASGHLYFTLKDEGAAVKVVMFRSSLARSSLSLVENGQRVVVSGSVSLYTQRGELQIIASDIKLQGLGDIFAALEKLKKHYQERGYFDPDRKKKLPLLPRSVGLITSRTGAACRDVINILQRRFPGMEIVFLPVKVQGQGAALEIAAAIDYFNAELSDRVDVLIVGRGGGSYEDLWAFNETPVIEAVYRSSIPVISAVGHEIDFTIADFVADLRAATPSAAAELVVGQKEDLMQKINFLAGGLVHQLERLISARRTKLHQCLLDSGLARFPARVLERMQLLDGADLEMQRRLNDLLDNRRRKLAGLAERLAAQDLGRRSQLAAAQLQNAALRLHKAFTSGLQQAGERVNLLQAGLEALSPQAVLQRGYSLTTAADGQVISDSRQLQNGAEIGIRFFRGSVSAVVHGGNHE